MKNGILVLLRPFVCDQKFYIFKEGEVTVEGYLPYDDNFSAEMAEVAVANDLKDINISGPYNYAIKTYEGIQKYCNTKFQDKELNINILSKKS